MTDWLKNKGAGPWNFKSQPNWLKNDNAGVWPFTNQPDVWGYLNNKWWSTQTDAQAFCNMKGLPLDLPGEHFPCGHWHKKEGIAPEYIPFPVGRLYGWDSLVAESYAFAWDYDYKRAVKVDLNSLNAVDFVTVNPGYPWVYQVMDICYRYIYEIFYDGAYLKIYKVDVDSMEIVAANVLYLGSGFGIANGCADNQYLFLGVADHWVASINTDLSNLVLSHVDEWAGIINGSRGMKIDEINNLIYACGSGGTKKLSSIDFSVQATYSSNNQYGLWPGGNIWEGGLLIGPSYDYVFAEIGYHPFYPRYYRAMDQTYDEYPCSQAPAYWCDWDNSGNIFMTGHNFFGYTWWTQNLQKATYSEEIIEFSKTSTPEDPLDMFGYDLACNKSTNQPVTKTINAPYLNPDEIGTWLSKFDANCNNLVYRHKIEGLKTILPPEPIEDLEPQIWTMARTF